MREKWMNTFIIFSMVMAVVAMIISFSPAMTGQEAVDYARAHGYPKAEFARRGSIISLCARGYTGIEVVPGDIMVCASNWPGARTYIYR